APCAPAEFNFPTESSFSHDLHLAGSSGECLLDPLLSCPSRREHVVCGDVLINLRRSVVASDGTKNHRDIPATWSASECRRSLLATRRPSRRPAAAFRSYKHAGRLKQTNLARTYAGPAPLALAADGARRTACGRRSSSVPATAGMSHSHSSAASCTPAAST